MSIMDIIYDDRLSHAQELLPVFYLLPQNLVEKTDYTAFPRNIAALLDDKSLCDVITSMPFQKSLSQMVAQMVWPYLGAKGCINDYTDNDPISILAHTTWEWVDTLTRIGYTVDSVAQRYQDGDIPYLPYSESYAIFCNAVDEYSRRFNIAEFSKAINEHRCHEDFARGMPRHDFLRRWYHSDTKHPIKLSATPYESKYDPIAEAERKMDIALFKEHLSIIDRKIVSLTELGYSKTEISKLLRYKTPSAIYKRFRHIATLYDDFIDEKNGLTLCV